jgi:hypothetical protein
VAALQVKLICGTAVVEMLTAELGKGQYVLVVNDQVNRWAMHASASVPSIMAKACPRQIRGPAANGK